MSMLTCNIFLFACSYPAIDMTTDTTPSPTPNRGKYFCILHEVVGYMILVEEEPGVEGKTLYCCYAGSATEGVLGMMLMTALLTVIVGHLL